MSFKYYFKEPNKEFEIREYCGSDKDMLLSDLLEDNPLMCKAIEVDEESFAYYDEEGYNNKKYNFTLNGELDIYGNFILFTEIKSPIYKMIDSGVSIDEISKMISNGSLAIDDEEKWYDDVTQEAIKKIESKMSFKEKTSQKDRTNNFVFLEQLYTSMLNFLGNILNINNRKWGYEFISNLEELNAFSWIPAAFIKPHELDLFDEPTIVINDSNPIMKELEQEVSIFGILAHEMRHLWQYYQKNPLWEKEMNLTLKDLKVNINADENTIPDSYFNLEIEIDAYAFQIAFLRVFYDIPILNFNAKMLSKLPSNIEEKIDILYKQYEDAIIKLKKVKIKNDLF